MYINLYLSMYVSHTHSAFHTIIFFIFSLLPPFRFKGRTSMASQVMTCFSIANLLEKREIERKHYTVPIFYCRLVIGGSCILVIFTRFSYIPCVKLCAILMCIIVCLFRVAIDI